MKESMPTLMTSFVGDSDWLTHVFWGKMQVRYSLEGCEIRSDMGVS